MQSYVKFFALILLFLFPFFAFAATSRDYYQAGLRLYNQHEYNSASGYFKAAIQEDRENWQAYQGLGLCDYALGDRAAAKGAFDKSLSLHPNNPSLKKFSDSLESSTSSGGSSRSQGPSPVVGGGNFGLGLELGDPGTWGVSGKYWMDEKDAFQGALKLGGGTVLQFQYLWHDYDVIHPSQGAFPFYIGVGGDLALGGGSVAIAGCVPVGITYLFQKRSAPLDIFVELVPTIWFTGGINFQLYGNVGSRFYF